jgi:hypothetical protein
MMDKIQKLAYHERRWADRRRMSRGLPVTADELWQRILRRYPQLSNQDREDIFQRASHG